MAPMLRRLLAVAVTTAGVLATLGSDQLTSDSGSSSSSSSSSSSGDTGIVVAFWAGGLALQGGNLVDGWLGVDWYGLGAGDFVCAEEAKLVDAGDVEADCPDCDYQFLVTAGTVSTVGDVCGDILPDLPSVDVEGASYGFGWGPSSYAFTYGSSSYSVDGPIWIYSPSYPDYGWMLFAYSYGNMYTYVGDAGMSFEKLLGGSDGYPIYYAYSL